MHTGALFDLRGRTALVTGGGTGLGLQMATALAEQGAAVALASRREALCRDQAKALAEATGAPTLGLGMDITVKREAEAAVDAVVREWGQIDVLVNNAGGSVFGEMVTMSEDRWRYALDVNLSGAFYCAQAAGRHMIPRRRGSIINITSIWAFRATDGRIYADPPADPPENVAYNASKGGLLMLTRGLAATWGRHNVRLNCISPGLFIVERIAQQAGDRLAGVIERWSYDTPLGRIGEDDDLKGAVVFLASEASKYVTGQHLIVDGGWHLW